MTAVRVASFCDRIAWADGDHFQAKRLGALDFLEAHAAEGAKADSRKMRSKLRRAMLGGEDGSDRRHFRPDGIRAGNPIDRLSPRRWRPESR